MENESSRATQDLSIHNYPSASPHHPYPHLPLPHFSSSGPPPLPHLFPSSSTATNPILAHHMAPSHYGPTSSTSPSSSSPRSASSSSSSPAVVHRQGSGSPTSSSSSRPTSAPPRGPSPSTSSSSYAISRKPFVLSRSESFAFVKDWLTEAFEERKENAVSTRAVYDDYKIFCDHKSIEVMCPSAFGKLFKKVFPHITVRRLGPRGENFNHYYNLGRKAESSPTPEDNLLSFPPLMSRGPLAPPALRGGAMVGHLPPLLPPPVPVSAHHLPPPHQSLVGYPSYNLPSPFQPAGLPPMSSSALLGQSSSPLHHLSQQQQQQHQQIQHQHQIQQQQSSGGYHPPQYLLHTPPPMPPSFMQPSLLSLGVPTPDTRRALALPGQWNSEAHLDLMARVSRYSEWYLVECWPFQPINPAALDLDNLQHFITTDGPLVGRESLALSSFLAMSIAAFNKGDFEISREFFNRARSQLGYLFDETSIDIAHVLQPMSIVSHWWTGKDSSTYYHTLLSEMCGQLNALNSDLFVSSLQTHFLIKTYDVSDWKKKVESPAYPEHWPAHEGLIAKLHSQGGTWQATIAQLLDILEFLSEYQKRRQEIQTVRHEHGRSEARKRKRERRSQNSGDDEEHRGASDSSSSSSSSEGSDHDQDRGAEGEEREEMRRTLESIGQRLSTLKGQMDGVLKERNFGAMPRVATTVLKAWIMMVDTEYRSCLDLEQADEDRDAKRVRMNGGAQHQNGRTKVENGCSSSVKSEGAIRASEDVIGRREDRHLNNAAVKGKGYGERSCEEMVEFFATMDVPLRGVCMSIVHNFLRGPLLDILHRGRNVGALRLLLDLISPLSIVMSLSDIRHRLMVLLAAL